jgi:hypothetical protein
MDVYAKIAVNIIQSQEAIIGPVALEQAKRISGLKLGDWTKKEVTVSGDEAHVIDQLIEVYKELFGQISVEVSKEAAAPLIAQVPAGGLPQELK